MDINNPSEAVPYLITDSGTKITAKLLNTWTWDMDTFNTKSVAHGIASYLNICGVSVVITNDSDTQTLPLMSAQDNPDPNLVAGGIFEITNTNIVMRRRAGGLFDLASYSSGVKARGIILIWYKI